MDTRHLRSALASGAITRRDAAKAMAAAGVGVATFAHGTRRANAAGEILHFGWSGYDDPGLMASYIEKYGGAPEFSFWGTEDEAFQKIKTGGFKPDTSAPCTYEVRKWYDGGIVKELDESRLVNVADLFDSLKTIEGSVVDGKRIYHPMDWGNSTVIYRTDLVDPEYNEQNSWAVMYDERYKGRLAFYDSAGAVVEIAALMAGFSREEIFSLSEEQLAQVRPIIQKQRDILRFYWNDVTEIDQALAAGEIVAAYGWNESYVRLKKEGVPVGLMVPKEGIFTWCCGLLMHPWVQNEDAAYDLINAYTSPETGAYEIANWGYGHANKKAFELVDPAKLEELGFTTPEALLNAGIFFKALDPAIEESYIRLFEEVKAGA
ncbi:MAG: extracellular solute-binding protein [Alphaproteobacteria bacterium]